MDAHPAALPLEEFAAQCETRRTRRSGPGGQNRNKVETAVIVTHRPSGMIAEASERRTQGENLRVAYYRLRVNLALAVRRPFEAPGALWQARLRGGRVVVNPEHDDFPALLAEALDALDAHDLGFPEAAAALGCTATQLLKLLKAEPRAVLQINEARRARGRHALQ